MKTLALCETIQGKILPAASRTTENRVSSNLRAAGITEISKYQMTEYVNK